MRWYTVILRTVAVSVAACLIAVCVIVVEAVLRYNGTCGGLIPFLAAAQPCTLWQYVWSDLSFTVEVFLREFGGVGLLLAGIVFIGSAIYERFRGRPDAA